MTSTTLTLHKFPWTWQNTEFTIVYETWGQGLPILLLPAFSTVCSRLEMAGIGQLLAESFEVYTLDWLGFGDSQRPGLDYEPAIFHQLLEDFVKATFTTPVIIIAAGHASGYALQLAKTNTTLVSSLVLVAPTWLGPLCAMGVPEEMREIVRNIVRSPVIGEFLYFLNTTPSFLHFMYSRHVYVNTEKLTPEFIEQKQTLTQHTNARYAPAAFVTGKLDPVTNRSQFLDYFSSLSIPVLVIIAENAPAKSKAEMEALTSQAMVQVARLKGTLGLHEEESTAVVEKIRPFLNNKF